MKVGTDGVLLGAWAREKDANNILDIGTGTGLVALIAAQFHENAKLIDAIEIDPNAAAQAKENVAISPWANKINIYETSFQNYLKICTRKYDLIVCNPPFFHNSFKTPDKKRQLARHSDTLSLNELIKGVNNMLSLTGDFKVIVPLISHQHILDLANEYNLFQNNVLWVKSNSEKKPHRVLLSLSKVAKPFVSSELIIENGARHCYSKEYIDLTSDLYLSF